MKKCIKYLSFFVLTFVVFAGVSGLESYVKAGAATRKGYIIGTSNVRVYSNTGLTAGYGWIYPSDEVRVITVTGRYTKVTYPTSKGSKTGYIATGQILTATGGITYTSSGKFITYRRDSTVNSYGYVAKNDRVMVLGTRGEFTQIKYPVSGGYKYAFAKNSDVNSYLRYGSVSNPVSTNQNLGSPVPAGAKFNKKTADGRWYGYHDINRRISINTPVYAIADGTVTYKQAYTNYKGGVKKLTSYGNFIEFTSFNGVYKAKYCHLNKFAGVQQKISSSQTVRKSGSSGVYTLKTRFVKKGEVIGYIGQTGNAYGVHLHFELRKNNVRIDPTSAITGLI